MPYLLMLALWFGFAYGYEAKVEPYSQWYLDAKSSGVVVYANRGVEGKEIQGALIAQIENQLEKRELNATLAEIEVTQRLLDWQKKAKRIQKKRYDQALRRYQSSQKLDLIDKKKKELYWDQYIAQQNALLSTRSRWGELKLKLIGLKRQALRLKQELKNRRYYQEGVMVHQLFVHQDQYLRVGEHIAKLSDISKAKITLFLDKKELDKAASCGALVEGRHYDFETIWPTTDQKYITMHRAQIRLEPNPFRMGQLVHVEVEKCQR